MTTAQEFERRRWIALALLCFAQFIVVLDASIVNVALPSIGEGLDFSQQNLPWVVNAYVLTFGGFLLLGGRLADLLGRRRVFIAGLLLVAAASLAAGFAANEGQLIAARAAQGLGAAIISPSALSIVTTTFRDGAERNKALGAWGGVAGAGDGAPSAERLVALRPVPEQRGDDRERRRRDDRRAKPLRRAGGDQLSLVGGESGGEGRDPDDQQPGHEDSAPPEQVGGAAT